MLRNELLNLISQFFDLEIVEQGKVPKAILKTKERPCRFVKSMNRGNLRVYDLAGFKARATTFTAADLAAEITEIIQELVPKI